MWLGSLSAPSHMVSLAQNLQFGFNTVALVDYRVYHVVFFHGNMASILVGLFLTYQNRKGKLIHILSKQCIGQTLPTTYYMGFSVHTHKCTTFPSSVPPIIWFCTHYFLTGKQTKGLQMWNPSNHINCSRQSLDLLVTSSGMITW